MDGHILQLLHHWTHAAIMLWRWCCLSDVDILMRHDTLDQIQQLHGIVCGPQVKIKRVNLVEVLVLMCKTESWKMPV